MVRPLLKWIVGLIQGPEEVGGVMIGPSTKTHLMSGTLSVEGTTGPVEVITDVYGVPHVYGKTEEDVYFGLGYIHAQQR